MDTYGVGAGVLLLGSDDATAALGGVQCALALDDGLAGASGSATGARSNLGDRVPVLHLVGCVGVGLGFVSGRAGRWAFVCGQRM